MDDPHKMIARRKFRGTPDEVEGLLVEAIWLIVNENRLCSGVNMNLFFRCSSHQL